MSIKDDQFAKGKELILDRIKSWDDAYEYFGSLVDRFNCTVQPMAAMEAMYTMYAFLLAMKENPEEGDIKALTERMMKIIVYESEDKLGATLHAGCATDLQAFREQANAALSEAQRIAKAEELRETLNAYQGTTDKPVLH